MPQKTHFQGQFLSTGKSSTWRRLIASIQKRDLMNEDWNEPQHRSSLGCLPLWSLKPALFSGVTEIESEAGHYFKHLQSPPHMESIRGGERREEGKGENEARGKVSRTVTFMSCQFSKLNLKTAQRCTPRESQGHTVECIRIIIIKKKKIPSHLILLLDMQLPV